LANVVSYEQNVRIVLTKISLGEGDGGVVYRTDAAISQASGQIAQIDIPAELNVSASYPIAPLNDSSTPELAQTFVDYVLSSAGQHILSQYGFITPAQPSE
jgi:molybdate transport system substrate-binding protein